MYAAHNRSRNRGMSIPTRYTLLIVDRNKERLRRVVRHFDRSRFVVFAAVTGQGGLRLATKHRPDVILIGPVLEDAFGLDLRGQLARDLDGAHPLIFMLDDESSHEAWPDPVDEEVGHAFLSSLDNELESRILNLLTSKPRR